MRIQIVMQINLNLYMENNSALFLSLLCFFLSFASLSRLFSIRVPGGRQFAIEAGFFKKKYSCYEIDA